MDFKVNAITVQEYSKQEGISVQAVYGMIKRDKLQVITFNGVKMILLDIKEDTTSIKQNIESDSTDNKNDSIRYKEVLKPYTILIKHLKKQIKKLEQDKDKNYQRLESLFDKVSELKQIPATVETNVIDIEPDTKKKKKKKRKEKKGKSKK